MQLSPNSLIPVSYTASIPGDTTVYFVQAVLRDTQSSNILQILNLTNISTVPNRYTGNFKPVSDPSGLGRPIDITISVYTDSGHTTLSPNYQILQLNYTILQPWIQNLGMGGGLNIDYDKLQKMFDGTKVNNAEIGNEKAPKRERINYKRLEEGALGAHEATRAALSEEFKGHIKNILDILSGISKTYSTYGDAHTKVLSTIESRMNDLENSIGQGQSKSSEERNAMRQELSASIKEFKDEFKKTSSDIPKANEKMFKKSFESLQDYLESNLSEKEIKINYTPTPMKKEKEEKEKPMFAPEHIASLLRQ